MLQQKQQLREPEPPQHRGTNANSNNHNANSYSNTGQYDSRNSPSRAGKGILRQTGPVQVNDVHYTFHFAQYTCLHDTCLSSYAKA
jgi:hypothetical protein